MKIKWLFWWDVLREQLWFIPSVFSIAALVVAVCTLYFDQSVESGPESLLPFLETTGASGRIILGALVGALVTVVGLAFSMTMLSVSQMSNQYGPRLIRSVFDSNVTQYTLGMFLGTVVYCMCILRSIRDVDSNGTLFTPHFSILFAELSGAACLFALLTFSNHMTRCMRAETLIQGIADDLRLAADQFFLKVSHSPKLSYPTEAAAATWEVSRTARGLTSQRHGYLQAIELPGLVALAEQHGHRIELNKRPGDFVYQGTELARVEVEQPQASDDELLKSYRDCFLLGTVRTPRQDVEAGVLELVEAGVRALSPGVNDPMTAINVIDYVSSFLRDIAAREWPKRVLADTQGVARVLAEPVTFESILNAGFDQLRQYAGASVAVNCRLLEGLAAIAESTQSPPGRRAIQRQVDMLLRQAERTISEPNDLQDIRDRGQRVGEVLNDQD